VNIIKKPARAAVLPSYTIGEEIANSILHGIGALVAIAGLVLLNVKTFTAMDTVAVVLFTATMIGMFLVSTLYHAIQHEGAKRVFRRLDHSMIFVFIAGTYTPFCLIALKGAWGWSLFAAEWALALTGIILNIFNSKILKKIEVIAYILMGWAVVIGFVPLARSIPIQSIILLLAGGAAYTLGTVWYRKKHIRKTHVVWHAFVIVGTVCHWFSVWFFLPL
jgi:hemolysin III